MNRICASKAAATMKYKPSAFKKLKRKIYTLNSEVWVSKWRIYRTEGK